MHADVGLGVTPVPDRRFAACALLSLALHGAVGWWTTTGRLPAAPDRPSLVATLRLAAAQAPRASVPGAGPAAPAAQLRLPVPPPGNHPISRTPPMGLSAPLANPSPAAVPAPVAVVDAEASLAPMPAAGEATPVTAAPVASPAAGAAARDEALAAYRRQLTELIGRVREYPRVAALRGWEGEVRLHLRIARKGQLLGVSLERSSGYEVLDRHARAMIEDLPALPPLPGMLDGSEIQVVVPINYRLGKTT